MHEYIITHEHAYGSTMYLLKSNHPKLYIFGGVEEVLERIAEHIGIDYEPHKNEYLTITTKQALDPVEEPFIIGVGNETTSN